MIDERVNNALIELEKNLRNVESARQQVKSTVDAYDGLKNATASYVNSLAQVQKNIGMLVDVVGKDYENKVETLEKGYKEIEEVCKKTITTVEETAKGVKNSVSSSIKDIYKRFSILYVCNAIIFATMIILFFLK